MKKLFFIIANLFAFSALFGVDFFVNSTRVQKEYEEVWLGAFEKAGSVSRKFGVNLEATEEKVPVETINFSGGSYSDYTDEELEKLAVEEDKRAEEEEKKQREMFESMGMTLKSIGGSGKMPNRYRNALENRKKKRAEIDAFKYPFAKVELSEGWTRKIAGKEEESVDFKVNLYKNRDEQKFYSFNIKMRNFTAENLSKYLLGACKAVASDNQIKKNPPKFLDSIDFSKYRDRSVKPTWLYNTSVAALDDYSMVVRDGDRAAVFSMAGDFKRDLMADFDSSLQTQKQYFLPYSDGKNIKLVSPKTNKVFYFDGQFNKTSENVNNPDVSAPLYTVDRKGDLWIYDPTLQYCLLKTGKNGENPSKVFFDNVNLAYCKFSDDGKVWNLEENACFVFNEDGSLFDVIYLPTDVSYLGWVNSDSFLAFCTSGGKNTLNCFDFYGRLVYSLELPELAKGSMLRDYRNGVYYFMRLDSMNNSVIRFVEPEKNIPNFMRDLLAVNKKIQENPKDFSLLKKKAEIYRKNGGNWQAFEQLSSYLEKSPGDALASDELLSAELQLDKTSAREHLEKAVSLYDEYGEETAKEEYSQTMKLLERMKKRFPNDGEVIRMISDLKTSFGMEVSGAKIPNLEVETVALNALFPAFMNVYATQPAGYVRVKNKAKSSIKNVSVSAFVRNYMDFASKGAVLPELKSGEEAELEVSTILNDSVLGVNENSTVQMNFTLEWEEDGRLQKLSLTRPVTLYKKSAMNWNYTSMLSCFILPNDATVSAFKFDTVALSKKVVLSKNFTRAMNLGNALGAIPLNYVPDPISPASENVDNEYAIDTVRFPFDTLEVRGGDCDDMTTLYCSLLESAGVPAALVTTPGHIFCAFELGASDEKLLQELTLQGYRFYEYNEKLYVPVETTLLASGFAVAWKKASEEISGEVQEFIPVSDAREVFPPVNVSSEKKNISVAGDKITLLREKSNSELKKVFVDSLEKKVLLTKDKTQLNTIAKIFNSFGEIQKAKNALELAIKYDKNYSSAYKNLARLYKNEGDLKKYNELLALADKIKKPSVSTGVVLAPKSENPNRADDVGEDDWNY